MTAAEKLRMEIAQEAPFSKDEFISKISRLIKALRWDYNRCFKDESLDKDLFVEKYGRVMGEHYYNKFVHEFDGNILKMVGYFRGSEKEGQVFCDMITERIEKYEKRMSYDKGKLNN